MNKADLVAKVASSTGLTKKAAQDAMEAMMEAVMTSISKGDSVTLTGFGTFKASNRAARNGRNPQTGQVIKIPARTVPVFRPGKEFKDMVK